MRKKNRHSAPLHPLLCLIAAAALLLTACQEQRHEEKDEYYTALCDTIQQTCLTRPEANLKYIDSLQKHHCITREIAYYFLNITYYSMNRPRVVEYYGRKALATDALYNHWPRAYYICSRNMANMLLTKGDADGSLTYATRAYKKAVADPSPMTRLYAPGLLLFISLSQRSLGQTSESDQNFERCYQTSLEQTRTDTSFNAHNHFAHNTLGILQAQDESNDTAQVRRWIRRTEGAVASLRPTNEVERKMARQTQATLDIHKALMLQAVGQQKEADRTYAHFLTTDYARTAGGLIYQYRYLQRSRQWSRAAALIPAIDSIRGGRLAKLTLQTLKNLHDDYLVYQNAHLYIEAGQKSDSLMRSIEPVIKNQQKSAADELAVIFETQQKEAKIAEQQKVITRQQIIGTGISLLLVIVFLALLALQRQREARRTAAEHRKLQKAYSQLTLANEHAEESSRMKTAFIKQISHEIRTPLNVLSGFTQIITSDDNTYLDEQTRKEAAQQIVDNTHRITELVNKMLELSEASSRTDKDTTERVAAGTIASEAVAASSIPQAHHITFATEIDQTTANTPLDTNRRQAVRALSLLLNNAVKFTQKGSIRLVVGTTANGSQIAFDVEDTGIGIPQHEAEHIFEEFVQLDEYAEGTGIGLTVARTFARKLGGDVTLDTTYTGGARFRLTLPAAPPDANTTDNT